MLSVGYIILIAVAVIFVALLITWVVLWALYVPTFAYNSYTFDALSTGRSDFPVLDVRVNVTYAVKDQGRMDTSGQLTSASAPDNGSGIRTKAENVLVTFNPSVAVSLLELARQLALDLRQSLSLSGASVQLSVPGDPTQTATYTVGSTLTWSLPQHATTSAA